MKVCVCVVVPCSPKHFLWYDIVNVIIIIICGIILIQVFSVRLRDRGPDYRGFVQLPLVQDQDGNPASVVDASVLAQVGKVQTFIYHLFSVVRHFVEWLKISVLCEMFHIFILNIW